MSPVKHRKEERPQHCLRSSLRDKVFSCDKAISCKKKAPGEKAISCEKPAFGSGKPCRKKGLSLLLEDARALAPAAGAILLYALATHLIFDRFCPMLILTGLPCPGCGMTRALSWALAGQLARAWEFQPPVYGWILLGLAFGIRRYLIGKPFSAREKNIWLLLLSLLLLSSLVLYGYRIFSGFPEGIAEPGRTLWEAVEDACDKFL